MIYIAGTYEDRTKLLDHKRELMRRGFIVTSAWLNGDHEDGPPQLAAAHDLWEVLHSTVLILDLFHSDKYSPGKMTEYGMALATGMEIIVVGSHQHRGVFFTLADAFVENWNYDVLCSQLEVMDVERYNASHR